ncbi:bacterial regulatory helix-turn-helix, lysR family protein [Acinetobacter baumannii 25493_8]|uniref:LysR family transcriptional regulator MumR n=1 Tax=Acinetobacter TaxID=469 RepID=UPI00026E1EB9|nr:MULTISPECIES: LysR family transcriptional regulator MumR [Acinetobacter]EYD50391.1 bacterial regulatory helix-turn-helix, lysR family protein [Acinetobacter baumannii 25493_4]EYS13356.1 bacterial regulatory helix-turn-helix, lysR family protein [Acinetobacter baumannii 25569_7]AYX97424.1 LysR family transcriptional regulator [Acinetobacter sp. FDAARGOS_493]EHU1228656.1 LysR family transcriptional regulator [Acinetobacter baumannii]EHU1233077.1 LysR family transcriptional regulator [Acinetob
MNLKNLEAFYWVVTLNSFNKAATKLQTTQPAVSQKITSLENELGFKVLDRSLRQFKLTHKGMTLFKYAEKFMRLETDLVAELTENQHLTGTIRLGVSETIVYTWLVEYIEKVQQEFPKVSVEIVVDLTPNLQEGVRTGDLDMAFLLGPTLAFECIEQSLCNFELSFLAAPSFKGGIGQMSFKALMSHTILTYPKITYPYKELKAKMKEKGIDEPLSITSYSLATLLRLAEQGLGIAVVPTLTALKEITDGRLEILNTPIRLKTFHFTSIYIHGNDVALKEKLTEVAVQVSESAMKRLNEQIKK